MKAWQIFVVGVAVLLLVLFLPAYERVVAGLGAASMLGIIVAGFCFRPRRDVFYLRTTIALSRADRSLSIEHERIAVRVELARLWLLFLPTFGALSFLLVTAARGITWKVSLLDALFFANSYSMPLLIRGFLVVVVGLLSTWFSERWVLRNADACSANSVSPLAGRILYSFKDRSGAYYGGEGFPFWLVRSPILATIVLYKVDKPELNKIASGCLFHRLVIIGRGITDLDEATVAAHQLKTQSAPQSI